MQDGKSGVPRPIARKMVPGRPFVFVKRAPALVKFGLGRPPMLLPRVPEALARCVGKQEEHAFALAGEARGEGDTGRGFTCAAFLRGYRDNHTSSIALKAHHGFFSAITYCLYDTLFHIRS